MSSRESAVRELACSICGSATPHTDEGDNWRCTGCRTRILKTTVDESEAAFIAVYEFDLHMTFVGPMPERDNRAAPEATKARFAAVEAVRAVLREHGFTVTHTGHGTRRTGSSVVDSDVLA